MAVQIQLRNDTTAAWTANDPVLALGEIGIDTDLGQLRIGDGESTWSELPYFVNAAAIGGQLEGFLLEEEKGVADGVATLDANGLIPVEQLNLTNPSFTLDLFETYVSVAELPINLKFNDPYYGSSKIFVYQPNLNNLDLVGKTARVSGCGIYDGSYQITEVSQQGVHLLLTVTGINTTPSSGYISGNIEFGTGGLGGPITISADVLSQLDGVTSGIQSQIDAKVSATQAATIATNAVTAVIDAAPAALNTLNELAAALGDDSNFAATVTTTISEVTAAVSEKAPLDSPTFVGTVDFTEATVLGVATEAPQIIHPFALGA